ncbi:MAG: hypothetical protein ACI85K_002310 [Hyphomicrobiaceae bacterium]|jgi:hypothetical protein
MPDPDYDDEAVEEKWCAEMRTQALQYLETQRALHGEVGEWPAWHIAPYVSIWAVESVATPGRVGWWVVSGDLPTDYVSAEVIEHPRDAMQSFADRWKGYAAAVRDGSAFDGVEIAGVRDDPDGMLPVLESRAETLAEWAADDSLWQEA